MLKYRYVIVISVLALLIGAYVKNWKQAVKYKRLYDTAASNILAYEADLDSLK